MNSAEFREARENLGLSINQLAEILNTNTLTLRRWEMPEYKKTSRAPDPIACQVLRWLASGELQPDGVNLQPRFRRIPILKQL